MTSRNIPFAVAIPVSAGSDPDVIELEDCHHVYGDLFPDIEENACPTSPSRQHQFTLPDDVVCVHCGKECW